MVALGLTGQGCAERKRVCDPPTQVDHVYFADDADGIPPWPAATEVYPNAENQAQPTVVSTGDYWAVTYYESVTPNGDPDLEATLRVVGGIRSAPPAPFFERVVLSTEFDPCATSTSYFGDYISMTVLPRSNFDDMLVSVWADSRDGCLENDLIGHTWHQHTYGAFWQ